MFITLFLIGAAAIIATALLRGPRAAAVATLVATLLIPIWLIVEVGAVILDLRMAFALAGIVCVLCRQQRLSYFPLATDFVIVVLIAVQITSELLSTEPTMTTFVDTAMQWLVPYVLGRIAWRSFQDGKQLLPAIVMTCAVLSAWSVLESVTRVNIVNAVLGHGGSLQGQTDLRWGMKRAEGPLSHPIFFGLQMVLLFPLALEAARQARLGLGPKWWRWMPWVTAAGAYSSMSRGPQIGIVIVLITTVVVLVPKLRLVVLAPLAIGIAVVVAMPGPLLELLQAWSGEKSTMTIQVGGEYVQYSGTNHRILQMQVYGEALRNADWFGYGSIGLRSGSTTIPYVEDHLRQMFSSIDNHYLQFALQNGYVGIGSFLLLCFLGIYHAASAAHDPRNPMPHLSAATAGAIVALTLILSTVWLPSDVRFVLLVVIGMAGGMRMSRSVPTYADASSAAAAAAATSPLELISPATPPRRLVPGYPQWGKA
ncbi:MAG: O-antigen ligase family protein [Planctomycetia bacterium]|nr:O-antigen ligase family protein [Planctomycetia bacterium]